MDIRDLVTLLRSDREFMRRVAAWERLPAREARTAPFPASLDARLVAALRSRGIESLYTHQAQAVEAIARLLTDDALRAQMRERGLAHAARFSWEQAARQTADLYRRVANPPKTG